MNGIHLASGGGAIAVNSNLPDSVEGVVVNSVVLDSMECASAMNCILPASMEGAIAVNGIHSVRMQVLS